MLFFHQKIFKALIIPFLLAFLLAGGTTGAASPEIGVVVVDRLNLRQGRGLTQPLVKVLKRDDQVEILSRSKGWIKVRHGKDVGYVSDRGNYIAVPQAEDSRKSPKLDAAAAKAEEIQRQIDQQSTELSDFTRREKRLVNDLDEADRALCEARRKAAVQESEMKSLLREISDIRQKALDVQKTIDASSGYAVKRLVALYKLDRLGEVNLLASAATLNDLMRRKSSLEKILAHDARVVADLAAEKKRLAGLLDQLTARKEKHEAIGRDHQETIAVLSEEKTKRERLLAEIKDQKKNRLAEVKYLKAAAKEMDKTIEALRQEQIREQKKAEIRARKEAEKKARLAAQEEERKKARLAEMEEERQKKRRQMEKPNTRAAADRIATRTPEKQPDTALQEHAAPAVEPESNAAPASTNGSDFSAYQGLLKMPVSGSIITKFGKYIDPHSGAVNVRNGIEIKTRRGAPIKAVFSGQTIYSSWLKGYGNVIIIAHGEHFHTVYAHVDEVYSTKGRQVKAGEVIATVGDSGSMSGPSLYFEIRHRGNPVDPLKWINKS